LTTATEIGAGSLASLPASAPFVEALRRKAMEEFLALPTPSQDTEEWRYTDLSELAFAFEPYAPGVVAANLDEVSEEILLAAAVVGERAGLQIQHNGTVALTNLDPDLVAKGVVFGDLERAALEHPELVEPHLHSLVPTRRTKFSALHGALRTGGTFLYVPPGVAIEVPLQTFTWLDAEGAAVFPHTLIVAGEDSELTFIDRYSSPPLNGFSDAVVEIVAGPASRVRYVSIQEWGEGVTHLGIQHARLERDSELRSLAVGFGASLARAEAETVLAEQGASSEMLGLFFADGSQHFDHRSEQDHAAPNGTSDLLYKGALRDESRAVYSGWVHVRPGAQRTEAMQTNRNIVLSENAKADSIPNLEIEANDVKCGHAASVGPVEAETLFYLMSRGIPEKEAERLIVFGFFQEVLDRVTLDEVRDQVSAAIEAELSRGR
jgi:Fe-S cluster assembly protein SufD